VDRAHCFGHADFSAIIGKCDVNELYDDTYAIELANKRECEHCSSIWKGCHWIEATAALGNRSAAELIGSLLLFSITKKVSIQAELVIPASGSGSTQSVAQHAEKWLRMASEGVLLPPPALQHRLAECLCLRKTERAVDSPGAVVSVDGPALQLFQSAAAAGYLPSISRLGSWSSSLKRHQQYTWALRGFYVLAHGSRWVGSYCSKCAHSIQSLAPV
jgi:hypothetical protein